MQGYGFDSLPEDTIAFAMRDNDNPLEFIDFPYTPEGERIAIMRIVSRSATTMTMASEDAADHAALSIGAITSADKRTVYWINTSRPLPQ